LLDHRESKGIPENIYLCFLNYTKAFDYVEHKLWRALEKMGIPDHLTCLLRNLNVVQETAVRTLCGKLTGSRLRKEYHTAVCGHPVCSTYILKTSQKCWVG
jgi:hypothetical protein